MKLDRFDLAILGVLQSEGRITKLKLAERIGLSPSPCHERVKRLEQAGYIAGYRALIDLDKLVKAATIFVEINLDSHHAGDFQIFETAIHETPEVVECFAIGGGIDYLLKVVAPDLDAYQDLIETLLARDIGIARYFTYVVTKPIKQVPPSLARLLE